MRESAHHDKNDDTGISSQGGSSSVRNQLTQISADNSAQELSELLKYSILRCPQCGQRWLVGSMLNHDLHQCKSCGHTFRINGKRSRRKHESRV